MTDLAGVAQDNKPVLFVDTCALLDVLRFVVRGVALDSLNAVKNALQRVNDTNLLVILPPPVLAEYQKNLPGVSRELNAHLRKLEDAGRHASEVSILLGGQLHPPNKSDVMDVGAKLGDLVSQVVDASEQLEQVESLSIKAMKRVANAIPPAARGQEAKDCLLVEHVLLAAQKLRAGGLTADLCFLTSNKKDFGAGQPTPPLDAEFSAVDLSYGCNWPHAMSLL